MGSGRYMRRKTRCSRTYKLSGVIAVVFTIVLVALRPADKSATPRERHRYDVPPVQEGDLVFRYGHGLWSSYFRDISQTDKRFSHVGIVVARDTGLAVVHACADDFTGVCSVRRDSLASFTADYDDVAVFRIHCDPNQRNKISKLALSYVGTPFDLRFDLSTDDAVYCSQLVRLVVNGALGKNVIGTTTIRGREIVALDDCYLGTWATKIYDRKDVGSVQ